MEEKYLRTSGQSYKAFYFRKLRFYSRNMGKFVVSMTLESSPQKNVIRTRYNTSFNTNIC